MVAVGSLVLYAPGLPFAEGVVAPVQAVFLEEFDAVADLVIRPGGPADGRKLPDEDARMVPEL